MSDLLLCIVVSVACLRIGIDDQLQPARSKHERLPKRVAPVFKHDLSSEMCEMMA